MKELNVLRTARNWFPERLDPRFAPGGKKNKRGKENCSLQSTKVGNRLYFVDINMDEHAFLLILFG